MHYCIITLLTEDWFASSAKCSILCQTFVQFGIFLLLKVAIMEGWDGDGKRLSSPAFSSIITHIKCFPTYGHNGERNCPLIKSREFWFWLNITLESCLKTRNWTKPTTILEYKIYSRNTFMQEKPLLLHIAFSTRTMNGVFFYSSNILVSGLPTGGENETRQEMLDMIETDV